MGFKKMGRGYAVIGCDNPKNPHNMGSVLRAAGCYGASMVVFGGQRPAKLRLSRAYTDTQKAYRHIPTLWADDLHSTIPFDCVPVAVDLIDGAISLVDYVHPERAFYIFGAEDATLGNRVLSWCRDKIYIPTSHCMNLAATVNVVLYDRLTKNRR